MKDRLSSVESGALLEERLVTLAVRVMRVCDGLHASMSGRHVASQLLRCGTSPAANYSEARSAESRADFIHKIRIALKELNETSVWLRVVCGSGLISADQLGGVLQETDELKRILGASIRTARENENTQRIHPPKR